MVYLGAHFSERQGLIGLFELRDHIYFDSHNANALIYPEAEGVPVLTTPNL